MRTLITETDLRNMYNEMIDEVTPEIKVGYITFQPSRVLEELDNIAYECGLDEYYDAIREDYICNYMEA